MYFSGIAPNFPEPIFHDLWLYFRIFAIPGAAVGSVASQTLCQYWCPYRGFLVECILLERILFEGLFLEDLLLEGPFLHQKMGLSISGFSLLPHTVAKFGSTLGLPLARPASKMVPPRTGAIQEGILQGGTPQEGTLLEGGIWEAALW